MSTNKEATGKDLEAMTEAALRTYADLMRIPVSKDMTRKEILNAIRARQKDRATVQIAEVGSRPAPGWARIEMMRDPSHGASNRPVYVNANGYRVTVPRGVEVDVPIKVVNVLNDSKSMRVTEDPDQPFNSARRFRREMMPSYPFQLKDINPGPDPRPGLERSKAAKQGPREEFKNQFGRYPRKGELLEAQKQGFVKLRGDAPPPPMIEESKED